MLQCSLHRSETEIRSTAYLVIFSEVLKEMLRLIGRAQEANVKRCRTTDPSERKHSAENALLNIRSAVVSTDPVYINLVTVRTLLQVYIPPIDCI